jgi:hypothetical protein
MSMAAATCLQEKSAETSLDFSRFAARKAFEDLEGWCLSEAARDLPVHEVEVQMEQRMREAARLMLQAHLNLRGTGQVGPALRVHDAQGSTRHEAGRDDPWTIVSIFGPVQARRTAYVAAGHPSLHPLDEQAQLPARSFSYEVQRRVVEEAVRGPFDEAVESIETWTGNRLSKRSAEQVVADGAEDFDAFYAQREKPPASQTGPILVGAVDGKGVPMVKAERTAHAARRTKGQKPNKKKMATVATVFTQAPRVRTPEDVVASLFEDAPFPAASSARPQDKRVWASLDKGKEAVIQEVAAEMTARDPEGTKTRVVVTDGERALQRGVGLFLPCVLLILDFLHVLEKLWHAAYVFHAEGSLEAQEWVRHRALMILRGQVSQVVKGIRQSATKRGVTGAKRKMVDAVTGYFYRNRKRMQYDAYLAQGLPIASGAVEGACKNLVKDRMERSGMRWKVAGAEAVLKLRAVKLSGDMEAYWEFHITKEQERLHGHRTWSLAE